MRSDVGFSDEWRKAEREEREQLRRLESRLDTLRGRRHELLGQVRSISGKQRELYQRGQGPQSEAERLYQESEDLGRHLGELRRACDKARQAFEDAVIRRRELMLTFDRVERLNPEQTRREIAALELRQQTQSLKIEEENALIAQLRRKVQDLKEFEARKELAAQHEAQRKAAETTIVASRAEIDRLVHEMETVRAERDKRRSAIPSTLEAAGAAVAEMRAAGRTRAEIMAEVDALGKEIAEVEKEGRALLTRHRQRQEIAQEILREYSRPLGSEEPDRAGPDAPGPAG